MIMEHKYAVYFDANRSHPKRAINALVTQFPRAKLDLSEESVFSDDERTMRALFAQAKQSGFTCSFSLATLYSRDDALSGDLGTLETGPEGTEAFKAMFPKDAFDFSTACPRCGMGAAQVKPLLLSERSMRCKANFYTSEQGAGRILMRSEIGREIIEATHQPWCMRHPVTRAGKVVEEWMEAVPCATMPPLSLKSEGVSFGSTNSGSRTGEPPEVIPPCPVCGRTIWDYDRQHVPRLVYPRAAIESAQKHAVLIMYEPWCAFPGFDPLKRTFKDLYGLPWLLFNRAAIKVLLKHMQTEHTRDSAWVQPIFSE